MDRQYCPKCKCWVGGESVDLNFHSCGCRVVPAYSEAMRLQNENKAKDEEIERLSLIVKLIENHAAIGFDNNLLGFIKEIKKDPFGFEQALKGGDA